MGAIPQALRTSASEPERTRTSANEPRRGRTRRLSGLTGHSPHVCAEGRWSERESRGREARRGYDTCCGDNVILVTGAAVSARWRMRGKISGETRAGRTSRQSRVSSERSGASRRHEPGSVSRSFVTRSRRPLVKNPCREDRATRRASRCVTSRRPYLPLSRSRPARLARRPHRRAA